jgi:hypothetical protein
MSTNPYESPASSFGSPGSNPYELATQRVSAPATALMIVAGICIALLVVTLPFDIFLLVSGHAERLDRRGIDPTTKVMIRLLWGCLLLAASSYVFWGALQMKRLTNYGHARFAATIACVPCVGPCCLLGIPFGAWALSVLGQPEVSQSFKS